MLKRAGPHPQIRSLPGKFEIGIRNGLMMCYPKSRSILWQAAR